MSSVWYQRRLNFCLTSVFLMGHDSREVDLCLTCFPSLAVSTAVKLPSPCDITQGCMPDSCVLNFLLCSISILVLTLCQSKQMLFYFASFRSCHLSHQSRSKKKNQKAASLSPPQMEHKELFLFARPSSSSNTSCCLQLHFKLTQSRGQNCILA